MISSHEAKNKALLLLAKRLNPDVFFWFSIKENYDLCHICNKELPACWETTSQHGLDHLKEHNLLPFL